MIIPAAVAEAAPVLGFDVPLAPELLAIPDVPAILSETAESVFDVMSFDESSVFELDSSSVFDDESASESDELSESGVDSESGIDSDEESSVFSPRLATAVSSAVLAA